MKNKMYQIGNFSLNPVTAEDKHAYRAFSIAQGAKRDDYNIEVVKEMGYIQGHRLKNKQQCHVCKKFGPECIGHPVMLNVSNLTKRQNEFFVSELSEILFVAIAKVFCRNCSTPVCYIPEEHGTGFTALLKAASSKCNLLCECGEKSIKKLSTKKSFKNKSAYMQYKIDDVDEFYEFIDNINPDDLKIFDIEKNCLMNLFQREIFLLPISLHATNEQGSFSTKSSNDSVSTDMLNLQLGLFNPSKETSTNAIDGILSVMDKIVIGNRGNIKNVPSHIKACSDKTGLFRGSALCKRATSTARGVLTPNQERSGILMCPRFIANNIKTEITVSMHNIEYLQSQVGKLVTHVNISSQTEDINTKSSKKYRSVSHLTGLKLGDKILKSLADGDNVVFNRHPTLHTHSLIGYEIKIWDNYSFGLHQTNAHPHNADFDGDEGNIRISDSPAGRIETTAMNIKYKTFGVRSGEPTTSITYNGIVGASDLSITDEIPEKQFEIMLDIIGFDSVDKERLKPYQIPFQSGRALISTILPRYLNYRRKGKLSYKTKDQIEFSVGLHLTNATIWYNGEQSENITMLRGEITRKNKSTETEKPVEYMVSFPYNGDILYVIKGKIEKYDVEIENGVLLYGQLKAVDIGESSYGIVSTIGLTDKFKAPFIFIDKGYKLFSYFSTIKGITIPIDEYVVNSIKFKKQEVQSIISKINEDVLKLEQRKKTLSPNAAQIVENVISGMISLFISNANDMVKESQKKKERVQIQLGSNKETYPVYSDLAKITYISEARGNIDHVRTCEALVGQQFAGRNRLTSRRNSPYSEIGSKNIEDNGFIRSNYAGGLTPKEVVTMSNPAREAAYITYMGTPDSGDASRQTSLHLNGIIIGPDFSIIGRDKTQLSSLYGIGSNPAYCSKKDTPLGLIESSIDFLNILDAVNAM